MKQSLLIFFFGLVMIFSALAHAEEKKPEEKRPQACIELDPESGFRRCATTEVVCYLSHGGQQCWPAPAPKPSPDPVVPTRKHAS